MGNSGVGDGSRKRSGCCASRTSAWRCGSVTRPATTGTINEGAARPATRGVLISLVAAAVLSLSACGSGDNPSAPAATSASPASATPTVRVVGPLTPADAQALATMNERVKEYVALHVKLERSLPKLPKEATPEQIDKNQRALAKLVLEARAAAKPGVIFTAEARPVIKRLFASVFGGPDGKQLKASIMDENPVTPAAIKLTVDRKSTRLNSSH